MFWGLEFFLFIFVVFLSRRLAVFVFTEQLNFSCQSINFFFAHIAQEIIENMLEAWLSIKVEKNKEHCRWGHAVSLLLNEKQLKIFNSCQDFQSCTHSSSMQRHQPILNSASLLYFLMGFRRKKSANRVFKILPICKNP